MCFCVCMREGDFYYLHNTTLQYFTPERFWDSDGRDKKKRKRDERERERESERERERKRECVCMCVFVCAKLHLSHHHFLTIYHVLCSCTHPVLLFLSDTMISFSHYIVSHFLSYNALLMFAISLLNHIMIPFIPFLTFKTENVRYGSDRNRFPLNTFPTSNQYNENDFAAVAYAHIVGHGMGMSSNCDMKFLSEYPSMSYCFRHASI